MPKMKGNGSNKTGVMKMQTDTTSTFPVTIMNQTKTMLRHAFQPEALCESQFSAGDLSNAA
jgi:hypothetical protein